MVLIISDERDEGTLGVIGWLQYYDIPFVRLNQEDSIRNVNICLDDEDVLIETINGKKIFLNEVTACWYRKGDLKLHLKSVEPDYLLYLENEWKVIVDFIAYKIEGKLGLGSYLKEGENNKLKNLLIAKSLGLKVPLSGVTSLKKTMVDFFNSNNQIITKSMHHDFSINKEGKQIKTKGTILVTESMMNTMEDCFFPSFIQEYTEKEYELRIFFLENKCYAICIFSQMAEETKVDQRNYNFNKLNRMEPYQLPKEIENKICLLMARLGLDSGSLDFIVNRNKEYVFLEVNPIGQFMWVSKVGNYQLERKIAESLRSKHLTVLN